MVVLLIAALILALALPRVGVIPAGVAVGKVQGDIEQAFQHAALRARATGAEVTLQLKETTFQLSGGAGSKPSAAVKAVLGPDGESAGGNDYEKARDTLLGGEEFSVSQLGLADVEGMEFEIQDDIEWQRLDGGLLPVDEPVTYTFYPNGEAAGPDLVYTYRDRTFRLTLDRLTGRVSIADRTDDSF